MYAVKIRDGRFFWSCFQTWLAGKVRRLDSRDLMHNATNPLRHLGERWSSRCSRKRKEVYKLCCGDHVIPFTTHRRQLYNHKLSEHLSWCLVVFFTWIYLFKFLLETSSTPQLAVFTYQVLLDVSGHQSRWPVGESDQHLFRMCLCHTVKYKLLKLILWWFWPEVSSSYWPLL